MWSTSTCCNIHQSVSKDGRMGCWTMRPFQDRLCSLNNSTKLWCVSKLEVFLRLCIHRAGGRTAEVLFCVSLHVGWWDLRFIHICLRCPTSDCEQFEAPHCSSSPPPRNYLFTLSLPTWCPFIGRRKNQRVTRRLGGRKRGRGRDIMNKEVGEEERSMWRKIDYICFCLDD